MNDSESKGFSWGYFYFSEEVAHPDDLNAARAVAGLVGEIVGHEGEYYRVQFGDTSVRVNPEQIIGTPRPAFEYGDEVFVVAKGHRVRAIIKEVCWHGSRKDHFFHVSVAGKRRSLRYFTSDILTWDWIGRHE